MLVHKQGGEAQARLYVFMLQAGVLLQNILLAVAGREEIQNGALATWLVLLTCDCYSPE